MAMNILQITMIFHQRSAYWDICRETTLSSLSFWQSILLRNAFLLALHGYAWLSSSSVQMPGHYMLLSIILRELLTLISHHFSARNQYFTLKGNKPVIFTKVSPGNQSQKPVFVFFRLTSCIWNWAPVKIARNMPISFMLFYTSSLEPLLDILEETTEKHTSIRDFTYIPLQVCRLTEPSENFTSRCNLLQASSALSTDPERKYHLTKGRQWEFETIRISMLKSHNSYQH